MRIKLGCNETRVMPDGSWYVKSTAVRQGCLEQGGVCGRIYHITSEALRVLHVTGAPGDEYNDLMDNDTRVRAALHDGFEQTGVKIVIKGHIVQ